MHALRFWTWTSGPPIEPTAPVSFGPLRYLLWTQGEPVASTAPLGFGPLRYLLWTQRAADAPINFGPFRFAAWAFGPAIPPIEPPIEPPIINIGGARIPLPGFPVGRRRILQDDEEVIAAICAWLVAKGRKQ